VENEVIVAVVAGGLAGAAGLLSAILSYRMAQTSLSRQAEEAERERVHRLQMLVARRRNEALEETWWWLFRLEAQDEQLQEAIDGMIRALLWLPMDARGAIEEILADLLSEVGGRADSGRITRARELVRTAALSTTDNSEGGGS